MLGRYCIRGCGRDRPVSPTPSSRPPPQSPADHRRSDDADDNHFHRPSPPSSAAAGARRGKPPPIERELECTLEELCFGCMKEVLFIRDVVDRRTGTITRREETHTVRLKPGWKKGTKITFENMGDELPGAIPADVVYTITEKEHPVFNRVAGSSSSNDLVFKVEVPLADALAGGWEFSFRLLTGEKMSVSCPEEDHIVFPGYEMVVKGQGMPIAKGGKVELVKRGDLRIEFEIVFPQKLSEEQRVGIRDLLLLQERS